MDSVVGVSCIIQYFYKYSILFVFCIVQPWHVAGMYVATDRGTTGCREGTNIQGG